MPTRACVLFGALLLVFAGDGDAVADVSTPSGPVMYFSAHAYPGSSSSPGTINVATPSTNSFQVLASTSARNRPMGVTVHNGHIYWAGFEPGEIWRSDLAGQSATRLYASGSNTYTRHIQFSQGKMYWNEESIGVIRRANLDGTSVETVVSGYPNNGGSQGIWDFEIANNRIYWTGWQNNNVSSTKLDGTDFRQFAVSNQRAFSIDSFNGGLIVSSMSNSGQSNPPPHQLFRMNFDGGSQQQIASLPLDAAIELLSVSVFDGRAYYAWTSGGSGLTSNISSVPIAGGTARLEMSVTNQTMIWQLDVVPAPSGFALLAVAGTVAARRRRFAPSVNA